MCFFVVVLTLGDLLKSGLTKEEHEKHVEEMVFVIDAVTPANNRFAELRALTTFANKVSQRQFTSNEVDDVLTELTTFEKRNTFQKRNPIAEIASMTDMMLIQTENEISVLTADHEKYAKNCIDEDKSWSVIISQQRRVEITKLNEAMGYRRKWEGLLKEIPIRDSRMSDLGDQIKRERDRLADGENKRKQQIIAFYATLDEHEQALADVQAIRRILQNSSLDDRSKVDGQHGNMNALIELKRNSHPKIRNLLQLASRVFETGSQDGMDKIYELIYKIRNTLAASIENIIKTDQVANSNWLTQKLAWSSDINNSEILKATIYADKGSVLLQIGSYKKEHGRSNNEMQQAIKIKEDLTIQKDFMLVSCTEETNKYSRIRAQKQTELKALQAVQSKLISLKWSNKVYSAVEHVSVDITYLFGDYNIKSMMGRYLALSGTQLVAAPTTNSGPLAGEFKVILNTGDLSYKIVSQDSKVPMFLMEDAQKVFFQAAENLKTKWTFHFHKLTNSLQIRNTHTGNSLNVDASNSFIVSTTHQTETADSFFYLERTGYTDGGCWKNKLGKQLSVYLGTMANLNTDVCSDACRAEASKTNSTFKYFGLSEQKQCFCGDSFANTAADQAPESDCSLLCPGRSGETCGGIFRTSIFEIQNGKKTILIAGGEPKTTSTTTSNNAANTFLDEYETNPKLALKW